ncbi:MAG TPA: 16S rRNA (cytidine(1402)-2'-O)-methyltransferase [Egibacteraceae bacterium]|nr:16S rRNA (cytidine(1402)-2'-O)-methyltransferase [Egibacteraceae bacterium]
MGQRSGDGRLVVVATPIGNLEDLSPRAARALSEADVVAAEDTRRTRVLLDHIGVRVPMVSHHEHNEDQRIPELLARVEAGDVVAVVSDAGVPGLADPGFRLVRAAVERGLAVEAVPGPAAAIQALVLSGLPMERFVFEGFLPRKGVARRERLAALAAEPRTMVLYVSPHRAADDLDDLAGALGAERHGALGRELTKLHEEVWRGTLAELADRARDGVRGEATLVVAGAPATGPAELTDEQLAALVHERMAAGLSRKDAAAEVARATGVPKRSAYDASLGR